MPVAALVLVLALLAAVLGPRLFPDPNALGAAPFEPPNRSYSMGTDNLGRNVLARVVVGARLSLFVGCAAAAMATVIGVPIGALAGFLGGASDDVLMRFTEFFQTMPRFLLAIVIAAVVGQSVGVIIGVLAVLAWPRISRITRGEFLQLRDRDFAVAARALGAGRWRIALRHILPLAMPPILVAATVEVANSILLEAYLSFVGVGDETVPSWGRMLNDAQQFLSDAWWMSVFPGFAIFFTIVSLNLIGDALNDWLDPRSRVS